ncbi:39S ribosomal protein L17, mitochondrial [Ischnura elegans]|uniref:39S ribosomal protein L17, mitochondrial n=1 Tax=Ischnura elegans TaxID=197161 RepID=UPI001ED89C49|nr:39S ribosomal protein L17, mitochondrial [Ischnura elegans]
MNQADVTKLVSKLRIPLKPSPRNLKSPQGPQGRLDKLRKTVTGLFKYERIELNYNRADEARGYAERLISEAIRHGDSHQQTMEMANFWLMEKQLIHKLFKVFVPRFQNSNQSYTRMLNAPRPYPGEKFKKSVLELRGNPFPSLTPELGYNRNLLHNVLLEEARKEFRATKLTESTAESSNVKEGS